MAYVPPPNFLVVEGDTSSPPNEKPAKPVKIGLRKPQAQRKKIRNRKGASR